MSRKTLHLRKAKMDLGASKIMGILNLTPDSFSDGGEYFDLEKALQRAWKIQQEGAHILDLGAESTRPGAEAVSIDEERRRLEPVLQELKKQAYPLPISLDTSKAKIASDFYERGLFDILNDVDGLRDPAMMEFARISGIAVVVMHMYGNPRTMQNEFHYENVVLDIKRFFDRQIEKLGRNHNVILDPGIGFGKSVAHNLELISNLSAFMSLQCPILIGASRKSFLGKILNLETHERLEASLAAAVISSYLGAHILRVHDVQASVRAIGFVHALKSIGVSE